MEQPVWLDDSVRFPSTAKALEDPNGLLAVGGDLTVERLLHAYSRGIFPWYSEEQPILWWSPSPRMLLDPSSLHVGRSTRKLLNKRAFQIRIDTHFKDVLQGCASSPRDGQDGTWITEDLAHAFEELHHLGHAHSVEAWQDDTLVGGLYGLSIGRAFFGESMFSRVSGASRMAFVFLARALQHWQFSLIDCQMHTQYLASFGASEVPRKAFESRLSAAVQVPGPQNWRDNWPFSETHCDS